VLVLILAAVTPSDTPHGYNWTFGFPMLLFIVIGGVLYFLFGRPHRRVPPRPISAAAGTHLPDPATTREAWVVGGLSESGSAAAASPGADDGGASNDGEAQE
jgi:hypothetical protein